MLICHKGVGVKEVINFIKKKKKYFQATEDEKSKQCLVWSDTKTTGQTPCCDIAFISIQLVIKIVMASKMTKISILCHMNHSDYPIMNLRAVQLH